MKILKRLHLRSIVFLIFFNAWLLIDEYIKEGYFFKPDEILVPVTHENIMFVVSLATLIINVIYAVIRRVKKFK